MVKTKVTDIEFLNPYTKSFFWDEVEFDTWDEKELAKLWWNFCIEQGIINVEQKEIEEEDYE